MVRCDYCSGTKQKTRLISYRSAIYLQLKCNKCGFVWIKDNNTVNIYDQKYFRGGVYKAGYEKEKIIQSQISKEIINTKKKMFDCLNHKPRLLDIGCAYGYLLKSLQKDFETYGIDGSSYAIRRAKKINPNSQIILKQIRKKLPFKNNFFEFITLVDTLEHFENPYTIIREATRIMKRGGVLFIKTYNFGGFSKIILNKHWREFYPPYHIGFIDYKSLLGYLNQNYYIFESEAKNCSYFPSRWKDICLQPVKLLVNAMNMGDSIRIVCIKK